MERTVIVGFIVALLAMLINVALVIWSRRIVNRIASMHAPSARAILARRARG